MKIVCVYVCMHICGVCVCACMRVRDLENDPGYLAKWSRLIASPTSGIHLTPPQLWDCRHGPHFHGLPPGGGFFLKTWALGLKLRPPAWMPREFPSEQAVSSAPEHTLAHVTRSPTWPVCEDELPTFLGCFGSGFLIKQPVRVKIICSGNEGGITSQRLHLVFFHWCCRRSAAALSGSRLLCLGCASLPSRSSFDLVRIPYCLLLPFSCESFSFIQTISATSPSDSAISPLRNSGEM